MCHQKQIQGKALPKGGLQIFPTVIFLKKNLMLPIFKTKSPNYLFSFTLSLTLSSRAKNL